MEELKLNRLIWRRKKNVIYPIKEFTVVAFSYWVFICPLFRLADMMELIDNDDEFGIVRLIGGRLLFKSWLLFTWLTVRWGCWLTATSITCCCCGGILGTDWSSNEDAVVEGLFVSIVNDDDDGKRGCWDDVSVDIWCEIVSGDVRLIELVLLLLLLLVNDENEIHISVLGKRSVHLLNKNK